MTRKNIGFTVALMAFTSAFVPPVEAGLFSSRYDDFKEFVQAGKTENAAALYASEPAYFNGLKGDKRQYVDAVLSQRDSLYSKSLNDVRGQLVQADAEPGQMLRWKKLKTDLPQARAELANAEKLLARGVLTNEAMVSLSASVGHISSALQSEAPQALLDYGLFTRPAFKDQYPILVRWADFNGLPAQFDKEIGKASAVRLLALKAQFADTLIPAQRLDAKLGEYYVAARTKGSGAYSFLAKSKVREHAAKEGWAVGKTTGSVLFAAWPVPPSEVSVYRATPPASVAYKQMEAEQTPAAFISAGGFSQYDLLVFVKPLPIKMSRDESNVRQVNSRYQSGTQRIQNPAYPQAQAALRSAEDELASVRRTIASSSANNSTGTLGALAAMVSVATEASAESRVRSAQQALVNTPQVMNQAVMSPYAYSAKTIAVKEWVTIHYAIYDTATGQVSTGSVERAWKKLFEMADQVHPDDPQRDSILKAAKTSKDVEAWTKEPIEDKYEAVWKTIFSDYNKSSWGI